MASSVQGVDSAMLYAILRLWGEARALKHKKDLVKYEAFMLAA